MTTSERLPSSRTRFGLSLESRSRLDKLSLALAKLERNKGKKAVRQVTRCSTTEARLNYIEQHYPDCLD